MRSLAFPPPDRIVNGWKKPLYRGTVRMSAVDEIFETRQTADPSSAMSHDLPG